LIGIREGRILVLNAKDVQDLIYSCDYILNDLEENSDTYLGYITLIGKLEEMKKELDSEES
jgi:hypothetical protein